MQQVAEADDLHGLLVVANLAKPQWRHPVILLLGSMKRRVTLQRIDQQRKLLTQLG